MARLVPIVSERPVSFTEEVVTEFCERLAAGETYAKICSDVRMPSLATIWRWQREGGALSKRLGDARARGLDAIAEQTLEIADGRLPVDSTSLAALGDPGVRDRLRVDTRMKLLAKWDPSRYGEATQIRLADADGGRLDAKPAITELLAILKPPTQEG